MGAAIGNFGLAGLGALQEIGNQAKDAQTTGLGSDAKIKVAVAGVAHRGHVETAAHTLSVHHRCHQGRLCECCTVVRDFNSGGFVIDENCLEHCDQVGEQTARPAYFYRDKTNRGVKTNADPICEITTTRVIAAFYQADVNAFALVVCKRGNAIFQRVVYAQAIGHVIAGADR